MTPIPGTHELIMAARGRFRLCGSDQAGNENEEREEHNRDDDPELHRRISPEPDARRAFSRSSIHLDVGGTTCVRTVGGHARTVTRRI
jgi:hypothetical protein